MNLSQFVLSIRRDRDWPGALLLGLIGLVAIWVCCLPFSKTVQRASLARFHLQSSSFAVWALQQPVPSMYNFENRCWREAGRDERQSTEERLTVAEPAATPVGLTVTTVRATADAMGKVETLNHFPARALTFIDRRMTLMQDETRPYIHLQSRYRGEVLDTRWRIDPTWHGDRVTSCRITASQVEP